MIAAEPKRLLSGSELLALTRTKPEVELSKGDRVRVFFSTQWPIDCTVVGKADRGGFIDVEEQPGLVYPVLAAACALLQQPQDPDDAQDPDPNSLTDVLGEFMRAP